MAYYCRKCRLNEMVIWESPVWEHSDLFEPCTLSMEAHCSDCGNIEKITRDFQNIHEYHTFLDKYKDD